MRPKKHKVKTLCQVQADGTSAPKATASLWAAPCLPNPPLGPPSGLSLQGRAIQTWEREAAGITLPSPGWGVRLVQGVVSCSKTAGLACSHLGPPSHLNAPLDLGGKMGRAELSQCVPATGNRVRCE